MEGYDGDTETVSMGDAFRIKVKKGIIKRILENLKCKIEFLCCCKSKCMVNENNISVNNNNNGRNEKING